MISVIGHFTFMVGAVVNSAIVFPFSILTLRVLTINLSETIVRNGMDNCTMDTNKLIPLLAEMAVFVKIVEAGTFSKAATSLGLSPSSVSRSVARLEQAVNQKLLERTTRKMRLTSIGEEVFLLSRDMLSSAKMVVSAAQSNNSEISGTLRVAAPKALARRMLMPHLLSFAKMYPKVTFQLKVADHFIDPVGNEIDVVIHITDNPVEGLVSKHLGVCKQLLCGSPQYLKNHGTPEHPNQLVEHNCISLGEFPRDKEWLFSKEKRVLKMNIQGSLTVNHSEIRREAVLQDIGLALFPDFMVKHYIESKRLVLLLPDWQVGGSYQGNIIAQYPQSKFIPSQLKAFVLYLQNQLTGQQ